MRLGKVFPLLKTYSEDFTLSNTKLVIDGKSYFPNVYKDSGCKYMLGGEYDRFADYLKKILNCFKECNVTLFVVFKGGMEADLTRRLELHEKVVLQSENIDPKNESNGYVEPTFVKDVYKQVLDELNIKYVISEYEHVFCIIDIAKYFGCPVVTKEIGYSLFGVSCIVPKTLDYKMENKQFTCKIFDSRKCQRRMGLSYDKLSTFILLMAECHDYSKNLQNIIKYRETTMAYIVHRWFKGQKMNTILSDLAKTMNKNTYDKFLNHVKKVESAIVSNNKKPLTIQYLLKGSLDVKENNVDWFYAGVLSGKIAIPYVNLKNNNTFSGSWLISENDNDDAMLRSMEIVQFAHGLLTNFSELKIIFIGKMSGEVRATDITPSSIWSHLQTNGHIFESGWKNLPDYFNVFICTTLPGINLNILKKVPEECRFFMISLVYFSFKINVCFKFWAYSLLLSYVMLGPVSRTTGVLKRSNFNLRMNDSILSNTVNEFELEECLNAANSCIELFYVTDLNEVFDRKTIHTFVEYQHCLQQLNYLNKLCGERIKGTIYHKSINTTFVYNVYLKLKDQDEPLEIVKKILQKCPSVTAFYIDLINTFNMCLSSVRK